MPSLDEMVGARVRELRESAGASRDALARAAQRAQMPTWDAGRVAHLERGRVAPTLPTLIGLAQALTEVSGRPVTLADLMPASGTAELPDGRQLSAEFLRTALSGQPVPPPAAPAIGTVTGPRLDPGWGKADDLLVRDLEIAPELLRAATRELYGRTATEERDARAGDGATTQKLGRVTRVIREEVAALLTSEPETPG